MEKTKGAIRDFMAKAGHHDTTVHETVEPVVQHETVKPTRHENINTAIDKEVHQDHFHRTVQPVHDKEVLPEQHKHNIGAVKHREFDHRDHSKTKETLAVEAQQFKDTRVVHDATHTQSNEPVVRGEHVHHHLHETIQPVVHKETIQPTVIHTTVPIHETHHNAAQHHSTSTLPPVTMDEFKRKGGALGGGRTERVDAFEGQAGSVTDMLTTSHRHKDAPDQSILKGAKHGCDGMHGMHGHSTSTTENNYSTSGSAGNYTMAPTGGRNAGMSSHDMAPKGEHSMDKTAMNTTGKKPSLLQKINPMTDADGDGKAGFMR